MWRNYAVITLFVLISLPNTEAFASPYVSTISRLTSLTSSKEDFVHSINECQQPIRPRSFSMTLVPLSRSKTKIIMPRKVTSEQWKSYWGSVPMESVQRVLESVLFAYGGAWMAWFLSFMAGNFISSIAGSIMIFNWIFNPYISAQRQNYRIWYSSEGRMLYHALFRGRIASIQKIRRRSGKTIGQFSQEFVDVIIVDEANRELEIITSWRNEYHALRIGMTIMTVVASKTKSFDGVYNVADAYVPAAGGLWLGDYPFLQKPLFRRVCRKELSDNISNFLDEAEDEDHEEISAIPLEQVYDDETFFKNPEDFRRRTVTQKTSSTKQQRINWSNFESDEGMDIITVDRNSINTNSNNS